MAVLAVLIAVNVVLLFLLFRPDRALTAQPRTRPQELQVDRGSPYRRQRLPVPAPRQIRRPRPDQSSRLLSNGCSSPRLPRRLGGRLLATATPPARSSGRLTVALAGNESFEPVRLRSCSSAPSQAAISSPLAVRVRAAQSATWRMPMTAQLQPRLRPANVWFPTPEDRDEINGPGGTKATPCNGHVIGLASLNLSRALVVCDDGAAMSSGNSGKTWRQVARIPDALAVTAGSGRYWVAAAHEGCDGVTVQSLTEKSGSLTRGGTRCAAGLEVAAGQVAFDVTGDGTIWLWSGSRVVVSRDDGQTWK